MRPSKSAQKLNSVEHPKAASGNVCVLEVVENIHTRLKVAEQFAKEMSHE
jgi:hypothetical protein